VEGDLDQVQMGDTITVELDLSLADTVISKTVRVLVRNSYDPNDKQVSLPVIDFEDYQEQVPTLDYLIRFQNTGNDTAFNITVTDTISSDLDLNSFVMGASSHDFTFNVDDNRIITWEFKNINLPDSGTNQLASNGYLTFSMQPKSGLALGTEIRNHANIYFDLNPPIITEDAISTIQQTTGIGELAALGTQVYPNPARDAITVHAHKALEKVFILDQSGREVMRVELKPGKQKIAISDLDAGLYILDFKTKQGESFHSKLLVE
ncbi:MAG: DUF7619 domain-containing protein, partial [Luteibaculum sp.]